MPTNNSLGKLLHADVASDFDVFIHSQMLLIPMQHHPLTDMNVHI